MEIEALTVMGLSTKRGDSDKIGMFGTGNKYAISVFVREGYDVQIVTSAWHGVFSTSTEQFRGKEYEKISLNSHLANNHERRTHDLGITSEMGLQWEIEDAMREFVCNARDEGGYQHKMFTDEGQCAEWCRNEARMSQCTIVVIKGFQERGFLTRYIAEYDSRYLFNRKPVWKSSSRHLALYEKGNKSDPLRVYKKGVLVLQDDELTSEFDYEMNEVDIDESRSASLFDAQWEFGRHFFMLPEDKFQRIYDNMDGDSFESTCAHFEHCQDVSKMVAPIRNKVIATADLYEQYKRHLFGESVIIVPHSWYDHLNRHENLRTIHRMFGDVQRSAGADYKFSDLDKIERQIVMRAVDFVRKAGYKISYREIRIKDLNGAKGWFHEKKIYLDKQSISVGIQDVVNTIIHEIMHRNFKLHDYTASFQDVLVGEIVRQAMLRLEIAL